MSSIEWTGKTWNPIVGCSKISAGCTNCYAIQQAYRNAAMAEQMPNPGRLKYYEGLTEKRGNRVEWTGLVQFVPEALEIPLKTKKPTTWFVDSMSDLFHVSVDRGWQHEIFEVMRQTPHHTYQILTKRPEEMQQFVLWYVESIAAALPNVWLGVTVENQKAADERIPLLLGTPAVVRFLSCEPLLEEVDLSEIKTATQFIHPLTGQWVSSGGRAGGCVAGGKGEKIDWVIVGGESGVGARPCDVNWIRSIVRQCRKANVPPFVKQLGQRCINLGYGYTGKGVKMSEFPADLQIREMP